MLNSEALNLSEVNGYREESAIAPNLVFSFHLYADGLTADPTEIPISSFALTRRHDASDYFSCVIPGEDYQDLVMDAEDKFFEIRQESNRLFRGQVDTWGVREGGRSVSLDLTGFKVTGYPQDSGISFTLEGVISRTRRDGLWTVTVLPDYRLLPGDTVVDGVYSWIARYININVGVGFATMEVGQ